MNIFLNTITVLSTFVLMEFVAWAAHKYVMHGFLWVLHKDHHQRDDHFFEKNDAFFLIFAVPSCLCFIYGAIAGYDYKTYIGVGIALYGFAYFVVHDIFIHQRFQLFKTSKNNYLKAIRKAHWVHHTFLNKEDGKCFGMLIVPMLYIKEAKQMSGKSNSSL